VTKKEAEKILKCKDVAAEIQYMWNIKTKLISVGSAATRTISTQIRKYLSNIPGNHKIKKKLQNTAILGPAHILQKMLM
jgi:hypothetical protein